MEKLGPLILLLVLMISNRKWLTENVFNTTIFEVIVWLGIFFSSLLLIVYISEENSDDKKISNDQMLKAIIISIIFTCVCAFFWYQVIN